MINPIHVHNVGELSRNYLPYKIMKEFIVVSDHLPVKLVEKVLDKESRILFIGNNSSYYFRVTSLEQLSLAVNKQVQRSMKTAIKCSRDLDRLRLEGQNLGLFLAKITVTGSSRLMPISLLRVSLLRFFKTITKNFPNAIVMHY